MAIWMKPDGKLVCAAENAGFPGDLYVSDVWHHILVDGGELTTPDEGDTWEASPDTLRLLRRAMVTYEQEMAQREIYDTGTRAGEER